MWGFVILTHPSRRLPTTSFILLVNTLLLLSFAIVFCALRQRWVIPYLHFKIRRLQIRIPSFPTFEPFSSGFLLLNFGELSFLEMSFSWYCRFRQIFNNACHAHAWRWILWEKHPSLPFSSTAPSPLVRVPFFQNKHSFYTPSSLFVKGERGFRPPSFFYGLLAWMFSSFN